MQPGTAFSALTGYTRRLGLIMTKVYYLLGFCVICIIGCDKGGKESATATNKSPMTSDKTSVNSQGTNATNADWKTTSTGLKYQVSKRGTGTVSPKSTDTVTVHYHGTLLNGTVFDSSVQRGQPASFPLNAVIPGWTEGLQLMKVGDKFKFEIPPNLAYGPSSPAPTIPPNSTLVFEVELLGIQ